MPNDEDGPINIPHAVRQLLAIVLRLHKAYPHKEFTLDGRLVGDIGEILGEEAYDVDLYKEMTEHHDGEDSLGRKVQIKATMKKSLTFPADHVPAFYIGIHVHRDGTFEEVFNGPGKIAARAIAKRTKTPKNNLHSVGLSALGKLNKSTEIADEDRIPRRSAAQIEPQEPEEGHLEEEDTLDDRDESDEQP